MGIPDQVDAFRRAVGGLLPAAEVELDEPRHPGGEWWIDVRAAGRRMALAWREPDGFGEFADDGGYGSRPVAVYRSPGIAAERACQVLGDARPAPSRDGAAGIPLSQVRGLMKVQQAALAARLDVNQAAVSKLESRADAKLSTLAAYAAALGGVLEVKMRFPEFETCIPAGNVPREDEACP